MEDKEAPNSVFTMRIKGMAMLTVCSVFSLRNLPSMAEYGWNIIFFLSAAAACFFIPSALVSAELASTYPQRGGVFIWVKEAFGPKLGFLAIFMEWFQNMPWYPAAVTFVATCIAYIFNPELASNRWYIFFTAIFLLWLSTFLNFRGMRLSVFLSNSGVVVGTIIPGFFLIVCALTYVWLGKPVQINLDGGKALIPDLSTARQWMLLAGMMVSLAGMEMSSVHVTSMKNPRSSFPKSIYLATAIILILSVLGALSISLVVPIGDLSKSAGVCQSFELMLNALGVGWLTPILACLLAYGALASVVTWMYIPFAAVAIGAGAPPLMVAVCFAIFSNFMWGITEYAGGPGPIYFGQGFFERPRFYKINFILVTVSVLIVFTIGMLWWKLIGLY